MWEGLHTKEESREGGTCDGSRKVTGSKVRRDGCWAREGKGQKGQPRGVKRNRRMQMKERKGKREVD